MLKYVLERQDENIEFLKKIVSIKSLPCEEKEVAEALLAALQQIENLDDAFIDAAGNVIGVIRGAGTGPNVLLNGHMDVVPEGNLEKWGEFDPFEAVIKDGRMYGRGVGDMKAGLVAQFFAFKAIAEHLQETGQKLSGDLIFTGVVQEEPAEMFGMEHLFEVTMPEKELKCDVVYLSEPGGPCVQIGQRGKIELVVKTYGKACHSSMPKHGVNALEMMAPILQAIGDRDGFDLEPDPYLGESSITVTNCIARPGGNLSTIPYECEIAIDRRFSTKLTEQDLLNEFEVLFEKCKAKNPQFQATVEPRYFEETSWTGLKKKVKKWHPAWRVELENEFVQNTFKALKKVGQDLPEGYSLPGTDGSMSCAVYGIPTMIYSNINGETCHREPESILVSEYLSCIEGYIAILTEIYGLDLEAFQQQ